MKLSLGVNYVYLAVIIVDLLGFIGGSLLTWSSPVLSKLSKDGLETPIGRNITTSEGSLIASLSSIGGIVGPVGYVLIFEHFGRKIGCILIIVPALIACLLSAFAKSVVVYYIARFLAGISIATAFCIMPMFIGEISPKHNRGALITSSSLFISIGCLFSYCIGPYTSIMTFNLILCVVPICALVGLICLVPESPYYLIHKNKTSKALHNLKILRGLPIPQVAKELEEIQDEVLKVREDGFLDIFKSRAAIKAFYISTSLVIMQQLSGISIVLAYTQLIFDETGSSNSDLSSIIIGGAQLVTISATTLFIDRIGKKPLLYFSTTGLILSLTTIGAFFYIQDQSESYVSNITWLPLTALIAYIVFYNFGLGSVPWTTMGEIYPLNVKSTGSTITTIVYWFVGFWINYSYSSISNSIGIGQTFWIFAGLSCVTLVFVYFCVFETKGKTLQEIQDILAK